MNVQTFKKAHTQLAEYNEKVTVQREANAAAAVAMRHSLSHTVRFYKLATRRHLESIQAESIIRRRCEVRWDEEKEKQDKKYYYSGRCGFLLGPAMFIGHNQQTEGVCLYDYQSID